MSARIRALCNPTGRAKRSYITTQFDDSLYLKSIGISNQRHIKIATEGALSASALRHGISKELIILSDDAGQFKMGAIPRNDAFARREWHHSLS